MRVMVIGKATRDTEEGTMPTQEQFQAMEVFNEELIKAGVLLAGEGLHPSSKGKRIRYEGKQRTVIDGPFMETKELIAGYSFWQVRSMDEAVEWARRAPFETGEVELRPVFEHEDFGEALSRVEAERSRSS